MRHVLGVVLIVLLVQACAASAERSPCEGKASYVAVQTAEHRLWLCERGVSKTSYGVRLGKGGTGKTREGDGKVPLGKYGLSDPRPSDKYGIFIPIQYPTKEQAARGYTGRDVGVHGPHRSALWLGRLVNALDTTDGCVGLATDEETAAIAAWVRSAKAKTIVIE